MKESLWHRLFSGVRRLRQRPDWPEFAGTDWADRIMTAPVTDRLHVKQGRSIARWTLHAGGRQLVVFLKRHYRLPWWQRLLATLRPLTEGRVIVVLGAGGDRDTMKRPVMGEIASRLADVVIVTDDNPRSEDPAAIRAAVLAGADRDAAEVLEVGDRRLAIREAVLRAEPGDVILVAGKGHESGQEVAGEVTPFDDRVVAAEEIRGRQEAVW